MVIGQFTISIVLIIWTIVIYCQLDFVQNKKLGFNKEQKLIIPIRSGTFSKNYEMVKDQFSQNSGVIGISVSSETPGYIGNYCGVKLVGEGDDKNQVMHYLSVDKDYFKEFDLKIIAGRPFLKEMESDNINTFVINETAAKSFGWDSPDDVPGKRMWCGNGGVEGEIIGVAKDFHYQRLQREIGPLIISISPERYNLLNLTLSKEKLPETLSFIKKKYLSMFPGIPYVYYFLDEELDRLYKADENTASLISIFACMGIFIAILGLYGLATFTSALKIKEIGVRKVLGASNSNILFLFSKDLISLVSLANIIAWPLSYQVVNQWLKNFAYRINITILPFIIAGLATIAISLLVILNQTNKSVRSNPVEALKCE